MSVPAGTGTDYSTMFKDVMPAEREPEMAASFGGDKDAPSLYWRLPDGRVQLLSGGPNGLERAMRGSTPLSRYGMVVRANRNGVQTDQDEFAALVERGGANELTAQQTLGLRWHRRPNRNDTWSHRTLWQKVDQLMAIHGLDERTAVDQILPQLQGLEIPEPVKCGYCHGREFLTHDHLNKHEGVMHRDDVRTREMRESITDALKTQGKDGSGDQAQLATLFVDALAKIAGQNAETQTAVLHLLKQMNVEPEGVTDEAPRRGRGRPPKIVEDEATTDSE